MNLVFNRKELKFIVNEDLARKFINEISKFIEWDKYNKSKQPYGIYSIYFDTKNWNLAKNSFDKDENYRYKIRARSYENFNDINKKVFFEMKKKVNGISNKRRIALTYQEIMNLTDKSIVPESHKNNQIIKEFINYLKKEKLEPKTYLEYKRYAFAGENDLRITIDKDVFAKDIEKNVTYRLLDKDKYIIEIKGFNSIPLWLSNIISKYKFRECSFSKYGCAYLIKSKREVS